MSEFENNKIKIIGSIVAIVSLLSLIAFVVFLNKTNTNENNVHGIKWDMIDTENVSFIKQRTLIETVNEFLISLEYTEEDMSSATFIKGKEYAKDKVCFYILLDDEWKTLYTGIYNTKTKRLSKDFIWCGDKNNEDYLSPLTGQSYLYIVDRDEFNKKIQGMYAEMSPPDGEDVDYGAID